MLPQLTLTNLLTLLSTIGAMAGFTVMVYHLGVWRQDMVHLRSSVTADLARHRDESERNFHRLEQRFVTFDRFVEAATEHRVKVERWQSRVDAVLSAAERRLGVRGRFRGNAA